jgi:hypothetical protein
MNKKTKSSPKRIRPRRIIGFSLPLDIAADVKQEAARRDISLRALFIEMWSLYEKKKPT